MSIYEQGFFTALTVLKYSWNYGAFFKYLHILVVWVELNKPCFFYINHIHIHEKAIQKYFGIFQFQLFQLLVKTVTFCWAQNLFWQLEIFFIYYMLVQKWT